LRIRGKIEDFDYSITLSDLSSNGFNSRKSDASSDADGYENTTIRASLGY
jgi:vitamin B12 transporter